MVGTAGCEGFGAEGLVLDVRFLGFDFFLAVGVYSCCVIDDLV